ncbi:MAG: SRPBCC family protein [Anaerolineae bacterium]|nr:SRPBCC family protein [Anaerolineae bacterium]
MTVLTHIGGLAIADFTPSKLMVRRGVEIKAAPGKIWGVITDQSLVTQWMPSVKKLESVDTSRANADSVGTERMVVYGSGDHIKETVVYAERDKILAYRVAFPYMVKDHLSVIEIQDIGFGQSTVRLSAFFTPTDFTGYMMKYGVYSAIVRSSLNRLRDLCTA